MCPYMIINYNENEHLQIPVCEPKNNLCTLCIYGNANIFQELENESRNSKRKMAM